MDTILNAIIGCSVIYADICERLSEKKGEMTPDDCNDIVFADNRIRALVGEVKTRLGLPVIHNKQLRRGTNG